MKPIAEDNQRNRKVIMQGIGPGQRSHGGKNFEEQNAAKAEREPSLDARKPPEIAKDCG